MKNVLAMVGNGVCGVTYADMRTGKASVSIQLPLTYYAKGFESPTPHQTAAGNCGGLFYYKAMFIFLTAYPVFLVWRSRAFLVCGEDFPGQHHRFSRFREHAL